MNAPAFGLYPSRALVPSQRINAGTVVALDTPVDDAGVKLFRASYWLPVSPLLATAQAVRLGASALQVGFAPRRFDVGTGSLAWFSDVTQTSGDDVRIEFAWPATVVRVPRAAGSSRYAIDLLRADGDAVAADATATGVTGVDLSDPWVGSPLVVRFVHPVADFILASDVAVMQENRPVLTRALARAAPTTAPDATMTPVAEATSHAARLFATRVPALTLSGRPTSPRLKLFAEGPAGAALLWQALVPGEQGAVNLPAKGIVDEWAPALEQLRSLMADAATAPTRLRLDIESDAPCTATFTQLQLALNAELELLAAPQRLAFSGNRAEEAVLPLELPAGLVAAAVTLTGRVSADGAADAAGSASPADARRGALLAPGQAALQPVDLAQPASVAGLSICWQPLSDDLEIGLRLLTDGGSGPTARVLVERTLRVGTPQGGWLALRWPAIDLQAQRLWAELTVAEGLGVWLFSTGSAPGWITTPGTSPLRQALPDTLSIALLPATPEDSSTRPIAVRIGSEAVQSALPVDALQLTITAPQLLQLATNPITFTGGMRGSVTVESARLLVNA